MPALPEDVAVTVTKGQMKDPIKVEKVEYLTEVGSHHEYREKPLPGLLPLASPITAPFTFRLNLVLFRQSDIINDACSTSSECCTLWTMKAAITLAILC